MLYKLPTIGDYYSATLSSCGPAALSFCMLSVVGAHLALEMLAATSVNCCVYNLPAIFTQLLHSPTAMGRIFIVPDYFQEKGVTSRLVCNKNNK